MHSLLWPHADCDAAHGARWFRRAAPVAVAAALLVWGSPATALIAGVVYAAAFGRPYASVGSALSRWLLQACVVTLGAGMNLPTILHLGAEGALFAALSIGATLLLGVWLGNVAGLDRKTTTLISAGTAICGGSAIAAVGSVIAATEAEIAVSIGTVFLLNAVALYVFPLAGHLLHLSQSQFGLWAGVAIHDISSVVGAGLSYGPTALTTATAVKLSRTLWIIPLTLSLGLMLRRQAARGRVTGLAQPRRAVSIPWFIGLFLLASLIVSYAPAAAAWAPGVVSLGHRGFTLVLFLVGSSLSLTSIRRIGWKTVSIGVAVWLFVAVGSLLAIKLFGL